MSDADDSLPSHLLVDVQGAATRLLAGGVVAIPTETVYGLAAVATDDDAVSRIFRLKERPATNPLIVHIEGPEQLPDWAPDVPAAALDLADRYWPGPLTLVLNRARTVSDLITAGQDTVAVRVPDHPVTSALLAELRRRAGHPVALVAPSANVSGTVSPTTASHVINGIGRYLGPGDGVLDGGECRVGVESTIVDARHSALRVLRPGAVVIAPTPVPPNTATPLVPGSQSSHYAPRAAVTLVTDSAELPTPRGRQQLGLLAPAEIDTPAGYLRLGSPEDDTEFARGLYAALHAADDARVTQIFVVPPAAGVLRPAVLDRLIRAAAARPDQAEGTESGLGS